MRTLPNKTKWIKEACLREALKYYSRSAFQKGALSAYKATCRYNWLDECFAHMTSKSAEWTKETCLAEAFKYGFRSGFEKGSKGAYLSAFRNGWLDECCAGLSQTKTRASIN